MASSGRWNNLNSQFLTILHAFFPFVLIGVFSKKQKLAEAEESDANEIDTETEEETIESEDTEELEEIEKISLAAEATEETYGEIADNGTADKPVLKDEKEYGC